MIPSPNRYRLPVHDLPDPPEWTSKQAKLIWDLIRTGSSIVDLHVGERELNLAPPSFIVPRSTPKDAVASSWAEYLDHLQTWVDVNRKLTTAYGPPLPRSYPFHNRGDVLSTDDKQSYLLRVLVNLRAAKTVITAAGGHGVIVDQSGAYRLAPEYRHTELMGFVARKT